MNDKYDVNKMIKEAKGIPSGVSGVPILGQQVPVMHGIPVNGKLMTINDLVELSEGEFRELFLAAIISLAGGVYMAPVEVHEDDVNNTPEEEAAMDAILAEMEEFTSDKVDSE